MTLRLDRHKTNAFEHNLQSKGQKSPRVRFAEHGGWDGKWNMGLHWELLHEAGVTRPKVMVQDPVIILFYGFLYQMASLQHSITLM
jgi:hypothetical protein